MSTEISWPLPPRDWAERLSIAGDAGACVHVWAISLMISPDALQALGSTLSSAEHARAARFHFEGHRNRFVVGRGTLRTILGHYLKADPGALDFVYSQEGKPAIAGQSLQFNLTHSEDLALLAVCRTGRVGIDVEHIRPLVDAAELVERFFSLRENQCFQQVSRSQQPAAFFNLWTRKEALFKATGEGIAQSLRRVEVSFLPDEPAVFESLPEHVSYGMNWQLKVFSPASSYAAALATDFTPSGVECWRWNHTAKGPSASRP